MKRTQNALLCIAVVVLLLFTAFGASVSIPSASAESRLGSGKIVATFHVDPEIFADHVIRSPIVTGFSTPTPTLEIGHIGKPIEIATPTPTYYTIATPITFSTPTPTFASVHTIPPEFTLSTPTPTPDTGHIGKPIEITTPTPVTTVYTPIEAVTPTSASMLPVITKDPTDETVNEGGDCWFIANYSNALYAVWHFISPDGLTDYRYDDAAVPTQFPPTIVMTTRRCQRSFRA